MINRLAQSAQNVCNHAMRMYHALLTLNPIVTPTLATLTWHQQTLE